ncbi:MAG TPA: YcbK family protein [Stellaceae bacterium]|jgi:uncharacterized protein YcbK (DUF882 family)|nr:YcbK family protein [Stellaceae bacterium]
MIEKKRHARRDVLGFVAAAATGLIAAANFATPALALPRGPAKRVLAFHHLHTGESLDLVYWADGQYLPDATHRIALLLRDFRNDEIHPIDPKLLDLLARLRGTLRSASPYLVIGGYRSPETNEMLQETTEGVASNSLHMVGQAIDLRVPGRALSAVRRAAIGMKAGGVGYYPHSDFVHVDVGPVRHW